MREVHPIFSQKRHPLPVESNVRFCLGSETIDARPPPAAEVLLVLKAKRSWVRLRREFLIRTDARSRYQQARLRRWQKRQSRVWPDS